MKTPAMIRIGQLDVFLDERQIRANGKEVHVGSRAFEILELLILAGGKLVSKDDIMRRVRFAQNRDFLL